MRRNYASSLALLPLLAGSDTGIALAFAPSQQALSSSASPACQPPRSNTGLLLLHAVNNDNEEITASTPASTNTLNRRNALQQLSRVALLSSTSAAVSSIPQPAQAAASSSTNSDLFKPNPLTNSVLEKVRIWNQDEVDNIKYGGELESGSAKPSAFDQYVALLQPILSVDQDVNSVGLLLQNEGKASTKEEYTALFTKIDTILSKSQFDKINFKKAFNAFADNIYYSDPDRANLYLGGGAIPKNTQSIAYLLRNDVLTDIEDMRAETKYLLKELGKKAEGESVTVGGEGGLELEDIIGMSKIATEGMGKYLDLVPPSELKAARAKFSSATGAGAL